MPGQHFETGSFRRPTNREAFLPDAEYARALRALVLSTCDLVVLNPEGKLVVGRRTLEPFKGCLWIPGGRRIPGESFGETCSRVIKSELGIDVEPGRFRLLGPYSYANAKRHQPPEDEGSHTDCIVHFVHITDVEMRAVRFSRDYANSEALWISPEEVVRRSGEFHPAMVQTCRDYLAIKSVS